MLDHGAGTGEATQVAGLGEDCGGPDRGETRDGAGRLGELQVVEHRDHASFGVGQLGPGGVPVLDEPIDAFEGAQAVLDHAGGVGQSGVKVAQYPQAGADPPAAGEFLADRVLEARWPQPAGARHVRSLILVPSPTPSEHAGVEENVSRDRPTPCVSGGRGGAAVGGPGPIG